MELSWRKVTNNEGVESNCSSFHYNIFTITKVVQQFLIFLFFTDDQYYCCALNSLQSTVCISSLEFYFPPKVFWNKSPKCLDLMHISQKWVMSWKWNKKIHSKMICNLIQLLICIQFIGPGSKMKCLNFVGGTSRTQHWQFYSSDLYLFHHSC